MGYISGMNNTNFQSFNAVSDFVDYNGKIEKHEQIQKNLSYKFIEDTFLEVDVTNRSSLYLSALLVLLLKIGRQNSIVINVCDNSTRLEYPLGVEIISTTTFLELLNNVDRNITDIKNLESSELKKICALYKTNSVNFFAM